MKRYISVLFFSIMLAASGLSAKELSTSKSIEVDFCPFEVWNLLIKADAWSEWNPAVNNSKLIEGNGEAIGSKVKFVPIIGEKKSPLPIKLKLEKSEKPVTLEYTANIAGMDIVFGFKMEIVEGKAEKTKVTSYETVKGSATGLFEKIFSQEGLDKEHQVWVESIKKKLDEQGCMCHEEK